MGTSYGYDTIGFQQEFRMFFLKTTILVGLRYSCDNNAVDLCFLFLHLFEALWVIKLNSIYLLIINIYWVTLASFSHRFLTHWTYQASLAFSILQTSDINKMLKNCSLLFFNSLSFIALVHDSIFFFGFLFLFSFRHLNFCKKMRWPSMWHYVLRLSIHRLVGFCRLK